MRSQMSGPDGLAESPQKLDKLFLIFMQRIACSSSKNVLFRLRVLKLISSYSANDLL